MKQNLERMVIKMAKKQEFDFNYIPPQKKDSDKI